MSQIESVLFEQVFESLSRTLRNQFTRIMKEGNYGKRGLEAFMTADGVITAQALVEYARVSGESLEKLCTVMCVHQGYPNQKLEQESTYTLALRQKPLNVQLETLLKFFPKISSLSYLQHTTFKQGEFVFQENEKESVFKPECWLLLPDWGNIGNTYQDAVIKVFSALRGVLTDVIFLEQVIHILQTVYISETSRKDLILAGLKKNQSNSTILLPIQFGQKHRGQYPSDALSSIDASLQVPFGLYEVGIALLLHPEVFLQNNNLQTISCLGDSLVQDVSQPVLQYPFLRFSQEPSAELNLGFKKITDFENISSSGIPTGFSVVMPTGI